MRARFIKIDSSARKIVIKQEKPSEIKKKVYGLSTVHTLFICYFSNVRKGVLLFLADFYFFRRLEFHFTGEVIPFVFYACDTAAETFLFLF